MPPFEPQIHHFGVARPTPSRAIGREIATKLESRDLGVPSRRLSQGEG